MVSVEMIYRGEIRMKFKCRLRVILAERGLKHGYIADRVGISKATLSALVNDRTLPTFEVAYKIAEVLEMKIEDIWIIEE